MIKHLVYILGGVSLINGVLFLIVGVKIDALWMNILGIILMSISYGIVWTHGDKNR